MRNCLLLKNFTLRCVMFVFLGMMIFANAAFANVGNLNRRANRHFDRGEYEEALRLYDEALELAPTDGKLHMNRASALHRLGEYDEAERSLVDALANLSDRDRNTIADAHYNLGNTQFRQGEQMMSTDANRARESFSRAIENYINTLKLRPNDNDAKWNLQLAHDRMQEAENESQNQQDDNNENDDDGEDENQGGGQDNQDDNNDDGDDDNQNQNQDDQNNDNDNNQNDQNQNQTERDAETEMRQEEAQRLIEQFADDDEDLNRPPQRKIGVRQPEKMW